MRYYTAIHLKRGLVDDYDSYPFNIPAFSQLDELELDENVTFFIGENGTGKSTLIEAMAARVKFNVEGGDKNLKFASRESHSNLGDFLSMPRVAHPSDGYFFRAESFYNLASALEEVGSPSYYSDGKGLHEQSHGESFFSLLNYRVQGGGFYLFDEPEAALSPQRQLAFLAFLHRTVYHRSQVVIATHSPIIMAYPRATIYHLSKEGIRRLSYRDTEHYRLTKAFLDRPERMLQSLLADGTREADPEPELPLGDNRVPPVRYFPSITLKRERVANFDEWPFSLPAIRHLTTLDFDSPVTFLVGENGSGKSTLIEAIAVLAGINPEGGSRGFQFATRRSHSDLHTCMEMRRVTRPRDGYFLRAESFYNVASEIERLDAEVPDSESIPSVIRSYGGRSLHEQSHGESFYALLNKRLFGRGFYVFDEPEAALSPERLLGLLAIIGRLVRQQSQLIIATHSPVLMAYPGATIYQLGEDGIKRIGYQDTEHYRITKSFLDCPERMLHALLDDEDKYLEDLER